MGNHRSLGEFSIDKSNKKEKEELKFSIEPSKKDSKNKKGPIVVKEKVVGDEGALQENSKIDNSIKDRDDVYEKFLNSKPQSSILEETKSKKNNFLLSTKKLYRLSDFIAVCLSYLLFFLACKFIKGSSFSDMYKRNGEVALFFIALAVNAYYLSKVFFKRRKSLIDYISVGLVLSFFFSAICEIFVLISYGSEKIFEYYFFLGSPIFILDNICFSYLTEKIKEYFNLRSQIFPKDKVMTATTPSLQNASYGEKDVKDLKRGDLVCLKEGDVIYFDGDVVDGESVVSKKTYAAGGETQVVSKNSHVFTASKVLSGEMIVKVSDVLEDSLIYDNLNLCQEEIKKEKNVFSKKIILIFSLVLLSIFICYFSISYKNLTYFSKYLISIVATFLFLRILILKEVFEGVVIKKAFLDNILILKKKFLSSFLKAKNYCFDYIAESFNNYEVSSFRIYDERIDENNFLEALFSVFSKADNDIFKNINSYISKKQTIQRAYKVENVSVLQGDNIKASLSDTKLLVGDEKFMIEQKVQAQESDFVSIQNSQKVIYVAINDIVIGNFILSKSFAPCMARFIQKVNKLKSKLYLLSKEQEAVVDEVAKEMGLNLTCAFGGLDPKKYVEKLSLMNEYNFFSNVNTDKKIFHGVDNNVGIFDPIVCDTANLQTILYKNNVKSFDKFLGYMLSYKNFVRNFLIVNIIFILVIAFLFYNPLCILLSSFVLVNLSFFLFKVIYLKDK